MVEKRCLKRGATESESSATGRAESPRGGIEGGVSISVKRDLVYKLSPLHALTRWVGGFEEKRIKDREGNPNSLWAVGPANYCII